MLLRVKVHPGLLLGDRLLRYRHPNAALRSTGGLDEYQHTGAGRSLRSRPSGCRRYGAGSCGRSSTRWLTLYKRRGAQTMELPPDQMLWSLINMHTLARCLHVIADFGVADALGDGPAPVAELAASIGMNADALG